MNIHRGCNDTDLPSIAKRLALSETPWLPHIIRSKTNNPPRVISPTLFPFADHGHAESCNLLYLSIYSIAYVSASFLSLRSLASRFCAEESEHHKIEQERWTNAGKESAATTVSAWKLRITNGISSIIHSYKYFNTPETPATRQASGSSLSPRLCVLRYILLRTLCDTLARWLEAVSSTLVEMVTHAKSCLEDKMCFRVQEKMS